MGKGASGLGDFPELPVEIFHRIGRVNNSPDFRWILVKRRQVGPVTLPGVDHQRIFLTPFVGQAV